ncbi:MAG: nucleotidyl transferase AbiEii/AbiGii toxin family protein [Candidatus Eremiobacteraeota bacterium]|uniref:Protein containing DUF1814 n=1 Tax=mine drainage metagenome TaxID=410659 RepID=E6PCS9_9ZZZZ|nr:nucleotidyl transferase AbiEii/AbiGii toxin family protein [Candidatus Eremiobacteraeota bacterium]
MKYVSPEGFLLKGGVALDLRFARAEARHTKDIDIETRIAMNMKEAAEFIANAVAADLHDYFSFAITNTPDAPIIGDVPAYRFSIAAIIGEKTFEQLTCDIGIADENIGEPDVVVGRPLLEFVGIKPVELLAVPLPRHIGDKLHAYVRIHPNGRVSSRAKDLVDLALITAHREIARAGDLRAALEHVFANRKEALPGGFPPPPKQWERSYPAVADGIAVPGDYMDAHKIVARMLDPVLSNTVDPDYRWDPEHKRWISPTSVGDYL